MKVINRKSLRHTVVSTLQFVVCCFRCGNWNFRTLSQKGSSTTAAPPSAGGRECDTVFFFSVFFCFVRCSSLVCYSCVSGSCCVLVSATSNAAIAKMTASAVSNNCNRKCYSCLFGVVELFSRSKTISVVQIVTFWFDSDRATARRTRALEFDQRHSKRKNNVGFFFSFLSNISSALFAVCFCLLTLF